MTETSEIRSRMRAMRRALSDEAQRAAADAVFAHVAALDVYTDARCVMAYMPVRGELSPASIIGDVLASGRTLALPRCEAPGIMTARRIDALSRLVPGEYGLMEPDAGCEIIDPMQIDLVFAPGTAFDMQGHRIGQGGGYYDRFLPQTRAAIVGICHDFALLEHVPTAAHDYKMDMIVTPSGVIIAGEEYR